MPRKKIDKQDAAFWVYLVLIVFWAIYGFTDSAAAETIIRVLRDAFQLVIGN